MKKKYKKADLEELIALQLENLRAVHDLVSIMKHQNDLLEQANGKLKDELLKFRRTMYSRIPV